MRVLIAVVLVAAAAAAAAPRVTPDLVAHLETVATAEFVPIIVVMEARVPQEELMALTEGLSRAERRVVVERELRRVAEGSQREVIAYLEARAAAGHAEGIESLWLVNAVIARADRPTVEQVSMLAGVSFVDWDEEVPPELLMDAVETRAPYDEIVWGVNKIRAPEVWALGYDGTGVVVCVADGGVNYNHRDLADHMWNKSGYPNHGRNFSGGDPNDTMDYSGHGTHVAGTVASDGTAGSQCGVAPNATIMIAKLGNSESSWFQAWQWAISEGADVITQSWSKKYPSNPLYAQHRQASEATLAAGVFHTNSTGNQGHLTGSGYPIPFNIAAPACVPPPWLNPNQTLTGGIAGTVAVGATDSNDNRSYYSGRGPSTWQGNRHPNIPPYNDYLWNPGMGLLKPDIMAPGDSIKSCDYANINGYVYKSGTSMSTPCAAGAVALLLDYKNTLPPAQIQKALEVTAVDIGSVPGKENDYGAGRIDVYEALQWLMNTTAVEVKYFRAAGLGDRVRLSWDCAEGYVGFNIYREDAANAAAAPRQRLNAELITGAAPFAFVDGDVTAGASYNYWLEVVPLAGKAELYGPAPAAPGLKAAYSFALAQSAPNPARDAARIAYSLPPNAAGPFTLNVYDLTGRKVRTLAAGAATPGSHEVVWSLSDDAGRPVAPGVYLYRLEAGGLSAAKRLVVTR